MKVTAALARPGRLRLSVCRRVSVLAVAVANSTHHNHLQDRTISYIVLEIQTGCLCEGSKPGS